MICVLDTGATKAEPRAAASSHVVVVGAGWTNLRAHTSPHLAIFASTGLISRTAKASIASQAAGETMYVVLQGDNSHRGHQHENKLGNTDGPIMWLLSAWAWWVNRHLKGLSSPSSSTSVSTCRAVSSTTRRWFDRQTDTAASKSVRTIERDDVYIHARRPEDESSPLTTSPPSTMTTQQKLTLYTYFRSSASARVRTVMALHNIPRDDVYIHLLKGDQISPEYKAVNPSASVPTLVVHRESGGDFTLSQCIAIMEYLDEVYGPTSPTGRLLPSDPEARATVRSIVDLVVGDLFPMLTMAILNRVKSHGVDGPAWAAECCAAILPALEGMLVRTSSKGRYAFGDAVSMADAALVPQIYTVLR